MASALNAPALFVAGAHTDIGKTHVACALIRAARARGLACDAFKPVLSGFEPARWAESDAGRLLDALGLGEAELDSVSPLRFTAPLAPPIAARREGVRLEIAAIVERCAEWLERSPAELKLLEGAGGLMSPIAEDGTALDLPEDLALPSILVGGAYLGAVSHVLTALEVLRARRLPVLALAVSEDADAEAPDFAETVELVRSFAGDVPVVSARRGDERPWAEALLSLVLA
ncbi:MAG TPA: dethiobiotin synthase [Phenylobacterium sp.]|uniref:dethiobiotin synthase n=1 Tax=Phenylobacterium sp. TaxID=1871053 RepID=UPI002B47E6ED|nr:dethiobiotin synthase [Phenylobacterium sp.]HKR87798.1 dethiobiotin synthase [Phenylobacterium sp.]